MFENCGMMMADEKKKEPADAHVQVAVRCRPLNDREKEAGRPAIVQCKTNTNEIAISIKRKTYAFDKVFGQYSTQKDVFKASVKPAVDEALAGYNCTVFAYGQTGTGKTYTMQGDLSPDNDMAGIIPRSVRYIFDSLQSTQQEYSVKVSFLQLYNEELKDLLAPDANKKLRLMEDAKRGGIYCQNLLEVTTTTASHVFQLLETGVKNRITSETLMNENSSRSHSIFTIRIHSKESNPAGEDLLKIGQLNLVDLAGSECVGRSGARNIRAREAGNINQSLLTLGRVITALVDNHPHVPYRDSKLTRLLQESLGGRAKTTIIATLAPCADSIDETMSTLDYAYRARSIKNKPEVNQKMTKHALLKEYGNEIESLRNALQAARQKDGIYLPPAQFQEMQERIAGQAAQLSELEDELEARTTTMKVLEEAMVLKNEQVGALEAEKNQLTTELEQTKAKWKQTQHELDTTVVHLRQTEETLRLYQQNEQVLLHNGELARKQYEQSELRAQQLVEKIDRKQAIEDENQQLAKSHSSHAADQLTAFEKRLQQHQEAQQQSLTRVEQSIAKLGQVHSTDLSKILNSLEQVNALVETHKQERASLFDKSNQLKDAHRVQHCDLATEKQIKTMEHLEQLIALSQQHAAQAIQDLEQHHNVMQTQQEDVKKQMTSSRDDLDRFVTTQTQQLKELEHLVQQALEEETNTLKQNQDKLIRALEQAHASQQEQQTQMKSTIDLFFARMQSDQDTAFKRHQELITAQTNEQDQRMRAIQSTTSTSLGAVIASASEWHQEQSNKLVTTEDLVVAMKQRSVNAQTQQIELLSTQCAERTTKMTDVRTAEENYHERMVKLFQEQETEANAVREHQIANETGYLNQHTQLSTTLSTDCQQMAANVTASMEATTVQVTAMANASDAMIQDATNEAQQQQQEWTTYLTKHKMDERTGRTPTKPTAPAFPSFTATAIASHHTKRKRTLSNASDGSDSPRPKHLHVDHVEEQADDVMKPVESQDDPTEANQSTSAIVPPKKYRALSDATNKM